MTNICLVRHGETFWNSLHKIQGRQDISLNLNGINQSIDLGNRLKQLNINWDYVYSSPLKRAYETAKVSLDTANINKEIILDDELVERAFGELEGAPVNKENYVIMVNGGASGMESLDDLKVRSYNAIINICKKHPNTNILVYTHSQVIKGLLTYLDNNFDFTSPLGNTSLNFFSYENDNLKLVGLNK